MKFAYADPPYLGCAMKLYGDHPDAAVYDTVEGHRLLIERLCDEYADGWALSMASTNLRTLLPLCPEDARVGAWVKPFASFKPGVPVAYAWEPVVFRGGRKRGRDEPTVRDWVSEVIMLKKGCPGAKPPKFVMWVIDLLGAAPEDDLDDLFPGSGIVGRVIDGWREGKTGAFQEQLFGDAA